MRAADAGRGPPRSRRSAARPTRCPGRPAPGASSRPTRSGPPPQGQMPTSATIAPLRVPGAPVAAPRAGAARGRAGCGRPRTPRRPCLRWSGRSRRTTCSTQPRRRRPPRAPTRTRTTPGTRRRSSRSSRASTSTARITGRNAGPVVTQYEVTPAAHIKLSRIDALSDDLAMALAARSIRIESPIPGKSAVGIEVPNKEFNIVALRRILEEVDFQGSGSRLTFALGRDVAGKAMAVDLARMPHLLIAGATGSGKSVMVNALITSLLCNAKPDEVRMILMDLKRVELAGYNGLPHLYVPVITEPDRAKAALKWAVVEMETRYRKFAGAGARNIKAYNDGRADPLDRLNYIVIVIDELADLMMREGKNVEDPIVRLAQKARATGIHMVLATQRPSVNVVTGLIKANFPSRIAFAMASQIDSRTILDAPGAEDLIGRGDMLYQPSDLPRPMRLQGVFVSDAEINRVTRALARPGRRAALRPRDHHLRRGVDRIGRRAGRRGGRPAAARCRFGDQGVRSGFGVPAAAAPQGRVRARRPDHRPARGARLRGGVRRFERPGGPPPRRRTGPPRTRTRHDGSGRGTAGARGRARRRPCLRARGRAHAAGAAPRRPRAEGRGPAARRARDQDPGPLPGRPRAGRLRGPAGRRLHQGLPAQLRALPRASTPRTSSASGSASAAT